MFLHKQIVSRERCKNTRFKSRLAALTITTVLTSLTVFAQEDYTRFKSEASVQVLGSFVKQTTQNGVQQSATDSSGVLATYRYYFSRHHGVEANYANSGRVRLRRRADINLTDHLFVRGEYRGFVYNSPTYDLTGLNGLDRVTHRAEPSIGFGWRF